VELRFLVRPYLVRGALPDPVTRKTEKASATVMSDRHVRERLANLDIAPDFAPGPVLRTMLESEIRNWTKFIDEKGIKPE